MAKDIFHQQVRNALIKDGWNITHDPLTIRISESIKLQIDLAAESDISSFHTALGQYLNYCQALEEKEPERIVYLAIPSETYEDFFQLSFIQRALRRYQVKLIIYDPKLEEIKQWIK